METRRALGRGLESLISQLPQKPAANGENRLQNLDINKIVPSPLQPRTVFDEEKIKELAGSIKECGLIQPLIVSMLPDGRFELVAGERRLRAARLAGLDSVPAVIRDLDPETHLELSIVENIQREDLNPIEEAKAYKELMDKFKLTHEVIAKKVGKGRAVITNSLRLLNLPKIIQDDVSSGRLSAGHARTLLSITSVHEQLEVREEILSKKLTVRDIEEIVSHRKEASPLNKNSRVFLSPQLQKIVDELKVKLGAKVKLKDKEGKGLLTIEYYSNEQLNDLYEKLINN